MEGQNEYKIHYFKLHGRADPCRALLNHAKVSFEDITFGFDTWAEHKPNMPNGQCPCLELKDGTKMGQSVAMARYLAVTHGYYPKDPMEAFKVDQLIDRYADVGNNIYKPMFLKDQAEIDEKVKDAVEGYVPKFLDEINDKCKDGWLVGDKISLADFFVGGLYTNYLANENITFGKEGWASVLEKYPNFKAYGERYAAENAQHLSTRGKYAI
jgi:glutathione S-transferase